MSADSLFVTARRTTLRPEGVESYLLNHAQIPRDLEDALRVSGVVNWYIWRDGLRLFHHIESSVPYETVISRMNEMGPLAVEWGSMIEATLDSSEGSDVRLDGVWRMSDVGSVGEPGERRHA